MPTILKSKLSRETRYSRASKNGRLCDKFEQGRPIIVELNPDETLSFRVKGTKTRFSMHITSAFELAKVNTIIQRHNNKMECYKTDKKLGLKRKKPKQPHVFYGKSFFTVLK